MDLLNYFNCETSLIIINYLIPESPLLILIATLKINLGDLSFPVDCKRLAMEGELEQNYINQRLYSNSTWVFFCRLS